MERLFPSGTAGSRAGNVIQRRTAEGGAMRCLSGFDMDGRRRFGMEEYVKALLEQIRCKRAWPMIEEEIRNHILDQASANRRQGMGEEEAVMEAVRDMGDPVEIGVSLDRIHRPRMAWGMMALIGVISVFSILIQAVLGREDASLGQSYSFRHGLGVTIGYAAMLLVYRIDYSYIGKYARQIAAALSGTTLILYLNSTSSVLGARGYGEANISVRYIMFLFIPVYGALLFQYRGKGKDGIAKSILWMALPVLIAVKISSMSLAVALLFIMAAMLSVAVERNWFLTNKKRFLLLFWSGLIIPPILCIFLSLYSGYDTNFRVERIKAYMRVEGYLDYVGQLSTEYMRSSRLLGNSGKEIIGWMPELGKDYILTFLASYYGIAAALLISLLLLAVAAWIIRISFGQRNQLGMIMGCGCGLVFEVTTVMAILRNLAFIPSMQVFFPFFSGDIIGVVVSYLLAGVVLSIYRYQNILPQMEGGGSFANGVG